MTEQNEADQADQAADAFDDDAHGAAAKGGSDATQVRQKFCTDARAR